MIHHIWFYLETTEINISLTYCLPDTGCIHLVWIPSAVCDRGRGEHDWAETQRSRSSPVLPSSSSASPAIVILSVCPRPPSRHFYAMWWLLDRKDKEEFIKTKAGLLAWQFGNNVLGTRRCDFSINFPVALAALETSGVLRRYNVLHIDIVCIQFKFRRFTI